MGYKPERQQSPPAELDIRSNLWRLDSEALRKKYRCTRFASLVLFLAALVHLVVANAGSALGHPRKALDVVLLESMARKGVHSLRKTISIPPHQVLLRELWQRQ